MILKYATMSRHCQKAPRIRWGYIIGSTAIVGSVIGAFLLGMATGSN